MATITVLTQPDDFSAAYSPMPLRAKSDDVDNSSKFKYNVNIVRDSFNVTGATATQFNGLVATQIGMDQVHNIKTGDLVLFGNLGDSFLGIYLVNKIIDDYSVIINLELSSPITTDKEVGTVISYKLSPDIDNEVKLDLSNTLKDYVTHDLVDSPDVFSATSTLQEYKIFIGQEKEYIYEFNDNTFVSGDTGFINYSLGPSDLSDIIFQVGDVITIEQNLFEWSYDDNFFYNGNVGFTGSTPHSFLEGQTVTVTGQVTNPYYNGSSTVFTALTAYDLTTLKPFGNSSSAEPGTIFGVPAPEYNTTTTIKSIYYDSSLSGVVIHTDIAFGASTQPIGGTIKGKTSPLVTELFLNSITGLTAYNARIPNLEYSVDAFNPFVIQNRALSANNISTIYRGDSKFRIDQTAKSYLLVHTDAEYSGAYMDYFFYDVNGTLLTESRIYSDLTDFYAPVGIDQLIACTGVTSNPVSLASIADVVDNYEVIYTRASPPPYIYTNPVKFRVDRDCTKYEIVNLMWKDSKGSWLSFPFKFKSKNITEFDKKTFYKSEGVFDLNDNSYSLPAISRGEESFYNRSRDKIMVTSGWINDDENFIIKDLVGSSQLYYQRPSDGKLIAAMIDENSVEFGKKENNKIYNYELNIRLASNEIRF